LLITNYGVDCAFAQIIYYHETGETNFSTVSPRNINTFLVTYEPDIILGFSRIGVPIPEKTKIIDNTKTGLYFFENNENFIYEEKTSRTRILFDYLHSSNKQLIKFCNIADEICRYHRSEEIDFIKDLYEVIGHDQFVYRFITNASLALNKNEQQLVLRNRKHKETIAKLYINDFINHDEGIIVCRSFFNLNDTIQNLLIEKYEDDVVIMALWDYTQDGEIRVSLSSKSDAAGKISEYYDGFGFSGTGNYKISIPDVEDVNVFIMEQIINARSTIYNSELVNNYEISQAEIESDLSALFGGLI
jgi:hypothetical protein